MLAEGLLYHFVSKFLSLKEGKPATLVVGGFTSTYNGDDGYFIDYIYAALNDASYNGEGTLLFDAATDTPVCRLMLFTAKTGT